MRFLNGWKTILGVAGTVATVMVASGGDVGHFGTQVGEIASNADAVVTGAFGMLAALGLIHKAEKRAGS